MSVPRIPPRIASDRYSTRECYCEVSTDGNKEIVSNEAPLIMSDLMDALKFQYQIGASFRVTNVLNYTDNLIYVLDDQNRITPIPPANRDYAKHIDLQDAILFEELIGKTLDNTFYNSDNLALYKQHHLENPSSNKNFYKQDVGRYPNNIRNYYRQTTVYQMEDEFQQHQGSFYLAEHNVVIISSECKELIFHPDTSTSELLKTNPNARSPEALSLDLYVNDIEHHFDKAFVNIGGEVMEVPLVRTPKDKSGIYLRRNKLRAGLQKGIRVKKEVSYYDFNSSVCPVKVFNSREEAQAYGEPSKLVDLEISRARLEAEKIKSATVKESSELKQVEIADRGQVEQKARDLEKTRMEAEKVKTIESRKQAVLVTASQQRTHVRNEKLESTMFWRKLVVEGVKLVTTILTTAATVALWMKAKG